MSHAGTADKLTPADKYPALLHASKVLRQLAKATGQDTLAVYLKGDDVMHRHDTDRELPFRQESNFYYMSGCDVPGSHLLVQSQGIDPNTHDLAVTVTLFIPDLDPLDVMWSGLPVSPEQAQEKSDVSKVVTVKTLKEKLEGLQIAEIHLLPKYALPVGINCRSRPVDKHLVLASQRARLIKTPFEIDLLQKANDISSKAHKGVMKSLSSNETHSEYEASAVFQYYCARLDAKAMAYETISGCCSNAGTLHYIKNHDTFPSADQGNLLLLDAGCEYSNYGADITRTSPIGNGGKFTPETRAIYELVLEMQDKAFARVKPGCSWESLQILMHRTAAAGLLKLGIFKKPDGDVKQQDFGGQDDQDNAGVLRERGRLIEDILASGLTTAFFPHGLGHMLGLDVHDCPLASQPDGPSKDPLLRYLRYLGDLEEGHVITVEPGIYFNPFLLDPFKDSPYLDHDILKKYMYVGGVRLEDDILVTPNGFHNFTTVERSVEDIEKLCQMNLPVDRAI